MVPGILVHYCNAFCHHYAKVSKVENPTPSVELEWGLPSHPYTYYFQPFIYITHANP